MSTIFSQNLGCISAALIVIVYAFHLWRKPAFRTALFDKSSGTSSVASASYRDNAKDIATKDPSPMPPKKPMRRSTEVILTLLVSLPSVGLCAGLADTRTTPKVISGTLIGVIVALILALLVRLSSLMMEDEKDRKW